MLAGDLLMGYLSLPAEGDGCKISLVARARLRLIKTVRRSLNGAPGLRLSGTFCDTHRKGLLLPFKDPLHQSLDTRLIVLRVAKLLRETGRVARNRKLY